MLHSRFRPLSSRLQPSTNRPSPDSDLLDPDPDPEDLFTSFLPHLFPDDAPSFHGDPGQHLVYTSPRYGDLIIMVPSYPSQSEKPKDKTSARLKRESEPVNEVEEGRKLFAHILWSAAIVVAEKIEHSAEDMSNRWGVKGERVLELGAGAALPSIISALAQAAKVTITDHPSSPAFVGAIDFNIARNIPKSAPVVIDAQPHEWGVLDTPFAQANQSAYTRIIAADCLWMGSQHEHLARTMRWFLDKKDPSSRVWVVAGFHTGRPTVARFFETATRMGMEIEQIYERDLNAVAEDGGEVRREWKSAREGEGPENRQRWCVVAVLRIPPI